MSLLREPNVYIGFVVLCWPAELQHVPQCSVCSFTLATPRPSPPPPLPLYSSPFCVFDPISITAVWCITVNILLPLSTYLSSDSVMVMQECVQKNSNIKEWFKNDLWKPYDNARKTSSQWWTTFLKQVSIFCQFTWNPSVCLKYFST